MRIYICNSHPRPYTEAPQPTESRRQTGDFRLWPSSCTLECDSYTHSPGEGGGVTTSHVTDTLTSVQLSHDTRSPGGGATTSHVTDALTSVQLSHDTRSPGGGATTSHVTDALTSVQLSRYTYT